MRTYVIDTSVLVDHPKVMYELGERRVVIPTAVIKEIDGLKRQPTVQGYNCREVSRTLDRLGNYDDFDDQSNLIQGVRLSTLGFLIASPDYLEIDDLDSNVDNRVVGTALFRTKELREKVTLLTNDINMRTIARARGLKTSFYPLYMRDVAQYKATRILFDHETVGSVLGGSSKEDIVGPLAADLSFLDRLLGCFRKPTEQEQRPVRRERPQDITLHDDDRYINDYLEYLGEVSR